jgi:hypothetical protein
LKAPQNFIVSAHAQKRAAERGISQAEFLETVVRPDRKKNQRRGEHGGIVYLLEKKFGSRSLHISAEIFKENCYFVTGYWT